MKTSEFYIKCLFHIYGRNNPAYSRRYRPIHKIKNNLFISGTHSFYDCERCFNNSFLIGSVCFLSSEISREDLKPGRKIYFYEGERQTGYLIVLNSNDCSNELTDNIEKQNLTKYNLPNENRELAINNDYQLVTISQNDKIFSFYLLKSYELERMIDYVFSPESFHSDMDVLSVCKDRVVLLYYLAQYHKDFIIQYIDNISDFHKLSDIVLMLEETKLNFNNKEGELFTLEYYFEKEIKEWKNILKKDAYPPYLTNIIRIDEEDIKKVVCNVLCECGNKTFLVSKNNKQGFIDDLKDLLIKEKKLYKRYNDTRDVKVKCSKCGNVYTLFNDSFYDEGKYISCESDSKGNIAFSKNSTKIRLAFYYKGNDALRSKEIVYEKVDVIEYNIKKKLVSSIYL